MGKKSKDKKKGKGAEKTALKTDKKTSNKMKKELQKMGEDDIENIVHQIEREEKKRLEVTETIVPPPSRRVNFTLIPHPDKEQLILHGGEFYDGQNTHIYNDLFFYDIPSNRWTVVKAPAGPPPRCAHQMVATSANKGQLWLFGGEFASPTQSQFYHYRDLWVYNLTGKRWEKIEASGGPSARSGHRMVMSKKSLIVFGGFHDNLRDYRYFNDVHLFSLESYQWVKIEVGGVGPLPRSGCCMAALTDGRVLVYGGYSKERVKKDVDKGRVFSDAFLLTADKNDTSGTKFKWIQTKLGGSPFSPSPRCSMPMTTTPNNTTAYCYGGVFDVEEDDENISGNFYDDFYQLDLDKLAWRSNELVPKRSKKESSAEVNNESESSSEMSQVQDSEVIADDGVFKVTVGPAPSVVNKSDAVTATEDCFAPSARINAGLAIKHGTLYLYGGMVEDGDKQITLGDFYAVDLKKMDEWKVLIADDRKIEWLGSDSESDGDDEDVEEEEDSDEEDEDEEDMDTN